MFIKIYGWEMGASIKGEPLEGGFWGNAGFVVLGGRGCFAGVAGESLFGRAPKSNQKARRLSGWLRRRWWFGRW
ncbi:hypothetical protein CBM2634_B70072 [Cupriavidus taiwanensis]|uniref:Uncharacterized protein n=1 Tax=Cupriavidus taiwanensis TaxID=164546 RepID=A0A375JB44_9BURK|nr:hypothetical protein CBM2634_B70072 [Cupriavidus taiwanensis]